MLINKNQIIIVLACLFLFSSTTNAAIMDSLLGPPPGSYKITSHEKKIEIPFQMWRGDILMKAKLNGFPVKLMIDNGFLWDPLLLFGSPYIDSLNLKYDGEHNVGGSGSGKEEVPSKTASNITLTFPGIEFYQQTAVITPYTSGLTNMWAGTEGQLSATFLKHFVVEFNYDRMVMVLTKPDEFEYNGNGVELPLKHLFSNSWALPVTITMANGKIFEMDIAMDLGYGSFMELVEGSEYNISIPKDNIAGSLGFGIQGETKGYFARIKEVAIGSYKFKDVVSGFVPKEFKGNSFHAGTLGLGLLSRFNFIYDYPHHKIYLEPNKNFNQPFEYNMTGIKSRFDQATGYREITKIIEGSSAFKGGLMVGDLITHINEREGSSYDIWELIPLYRQLGAELKFLILRGDEILEKTIVLERII